MISKTTTLTLLIFSFALSAFAQKQGNDSKTGSLKYNDRIENKISVIESLNKQKLDYQLQPISNGHFKLVFVNQPSNSFNIKIYDIIGNLILSEDKKYSLDSKIEYNFNEMNHKIYVVKVASGDDNLTKKINF